MSDTSIVETMFGPREPLPDKCHRPTSLAAVITVHGEIDLLTERRLEQQLHLHLRPHTQPVEVTVDLTAVTFISARGIAILVNSVDEAVRLDITFALVGCTPRISRIIAMWRTLIPSAIRRV